MTDPLDALHTPLHPVDPDPAFATRLRARIERALTLPRGVAVTTSATSESAEPTTAASPAGGVTPYIAVADARRALDWYIEGLGAQLRDDPIVMPDGRIGHAEIALEGGLVMLADAHPEIGVVAPDPGSGATVTLHASVTDVDSLTLRAQRAGATVERPPTDNPYGRVAVIRDPFGHRWMLDTPPGASAANPMRPGDLAYVSLWLPDADRAAKFFTDVLGWSYAQRAGASHHVIGTRPSHGIFGGQQRGTLFLCFGVDDISAAVQRVRAAGGRADDPTTQPHGTVAECVDNQGTPFALYQLAGDARQSGSRAGDLAYVTLEVVDSARARDFYAAVLGWRFTAGRAEDGWNVEDVVPMVGLHGGHDAATAIPMYRVDDIDAAVRRVRAAGGTSSDPQRMPYGITADCTDDQGTRFYLGQL